MGRIIAGLDKSIHQGQPDDISSAVFMTGAKIIIDGGVSCN